jgi:hypothetical protein
MSCSSTHCPKLIQEIYELLVQKFQPLINKNNKYIKVSPLCNGVGKRGPCQFTTKYESGFCRCHQKNHIYINNKIKRENKFHEIHEIHVLNKYEHKGYLYKKVPLLIEYPRTKKLVGNKVYGAIDKCYECDKNIKNIRKCKLSGRDIYLCPECLLDAVKMEVAINKIINTRNL